MSPFPRRISVAQGSLQRQTFLNWPTRSRFVCLVKHRGGGAGLEVLRRLADGCAAEAFLARQKDGAQRVVVEILRPDLPAELSKHFVQEAKALLSLAHPGLIRRAHLGQTAD